MTEEINALWTEMKLLWTYLRGDSGKSDEEKSAAKKRINEIQGVLGKPLTDWDAPYTSKAKGGATATDKGTRVTEWPVVVLSAKDEEEIKRFEHIQGMALSIAKRQHPKDNPNSDTFGMIVNAITEKLVSLRLVDVNLR